MTTPVPVQHDRTNESLANIHTKAAELLKRFHASRGELAELKLTDFAMAGIYARQLERREQTPS